MSTHFAVAILLGSLVLQSPRDATSALPIVTVGVHPGSAVSSEVVTGILEEAAEIWRPAGIDVRWRGADRDCAAVRVRFDDDGGATHKRAEALGWILFEAHGPVPEIHLLPRNAMSLMRAEKGALVSRMTVMELETLLSRALGRALAHELGHYLLESRQHTRTGLMQSHLGASQFFGTGRDAFTLDPAQRAVVAARMTTMASQRRAGASLRHRLESRIPNPELR